METTTFNFNMMINPAKKARLESVYGGLGLSLPEAVDTFFEQSLLVNGFPFTIQQPKYSEETEAAMHEAREIMAGRKKIKGYHSARELFNEMTAGAIREGDAVLANGTGEH